MWLAEKSIVERYNAIVTDCLLNDNSFNNFKNIDAYTSIVSQHPPYGTIYFSRILAEAPKELLAKLPEISKCDLIGNPITDQYIHPEYFPNGASISACNLRYVNTVMEIDRHFDFKGKSINVVEIGVGFGGLCHAATQYFNIKEYCLLDLENVQALASKCLNQLGSTNHTTTVHNPIDLLISEFCLSEFNDELIEQYYNSYVVKADKIFLRFNLHDEQRKEAFLAKIANDFEYAVEDEWPKTHWPNYVIIGTRK
jgi:hypothetical protein